MHPMTATGRSTPPRPHRWLAAALAAAGALACATAPAAGSANAAAELAPEGGRIVVEAKGVPPPPPLFFSARVDQTVRLGRDAVAGEMHVRLHVLQGRPEFLTLGLSGEGEVVEVSGQGLRDWAVRQGPGPAGAQRFLDLSPVLSPGAAEPHDFDVIVHTRLVDPELPGTTAILLATPGAASAFASTVTLRPDAAVDVRVTGVSGLQSVGEPAGPRGPWQFAASGDGRLEVRLTLRGAAPADAELAGATLAGTVNETAGSAEFRLRGQLRVLKAGARLRLLTGIAALNGATLGDGWHAELVPVGDEGFAYDLVGDRAGMLPVDLSFAAAVRDEEGWLMLHFAMPAGAVVPIQLEGLGSEISFNPEEPVVPVATPQGWRGFLPADGAASLAWRHTREAGESTLFFTSFEQADVRLGAGLLRQSSQVTFRILQGKLGSVRCRLDGPGEIVGVEGANVVGWKVLPGASGRVLEVRLSRPVETEGTLTVTSQADLGSFPVRAEPLRLTPEGGVRHSGFVRVANSGAVRLEVTEVAGMMQLAPAQFPGPAAEAGARQVSVYRFPSATYGYRVLATQIQPEVGVSEIALYELTDTDRVIRADLELDVREAPLRDWSLQIPSDYTVVALSGADVADYAPETAVADGLRTVKVIFGRPVEGRQLLQLRLEKNQPAAAGDWRLPPLRFPGAKTVRGHIGAVATAGYRFLPAKVERLTEVPLSYFPAQTAGLQQAWRVREPGWSADLRIEALGQSVQADVFHLYSLKEGVVYGSVLLNFFVVGAPASEWRIAVPPSLGNIDVTGQNVRRDWRREGDQVIISLHQPVLGAATLLITFEQPMSARGGTIKPGEVRPLNVQAERGYIQVVSPLQVKHQILQAEGGLLKLEPTELPAEFRLLTNAPSLAVYQYTARPFALALGIEWYAPGETVDQVVDFARLSSLVSRDGQAVTDARFFVKTRGRKALRLVLPAGVKLWETRVENEVVNARADGDQTLVPLPAQLNPNEPVAVALRLGQPAGPSPAIVRLVAPRAIAPTVISEWTVRGDAGRLLVPRGGNAELVRPALTERGFEWIAARAPLMTLVFLALAVLGALLLRGRGLRLAGGLAACAVATFLALVLAGGALAERRPNLGELTFAATMTPPGESVAIELGNTSPGAAMLAGWGLVALAAGALLAAATLVPALRRTAPRPLVAGVAAILLAAGMLAQRGGALPFFAAAAAAIFLLMFVPGVIRAGRKSPAPIPPAPPAAAALLILAGILGLAPGGAAALRAEPAPPWRHEGARAAQAIVQTWTIHEDRLAAELDLTVRGSPGDSFLLLRSPAVLTDFRGDGLRIAKVERGEHTAYYVAVEREGVLTAHARYEMAVTDRARGLALPTGPAAAQRITVELDQGGWEFRSPAAVQVLPTPNLGENHSGATLVLSPSGPAVIQLQPKQRDLAAEATQFFVEAANLYVPGPGVVNGFTRLTVRPVQGRVAALEIDVPKGLTVGDVTNGPVGAWRFDPEKRRLHVALEPAQTGTFKLDVETQLGAGALPFSLALEPLRVADAAGDVGTIALAFGGDAQPEGARPNGLTAVNVQDFDAGLVPAARGQPLVAGQPGGRVELTVAPVAPEVRVASRQVLSLDDDRLVMAVDLRVTITRVGLFQLSFVLPPNLEVEALSGAALSQWTEASEGGGRLITLHLAGRTIGEQTFALTLTGAAPHAQAAWPVPRLRVREATRQTGEILIVPGKGLRLRAVEREQVTQLDPRTVGGLQPGTLAFRILQEDWSLGVAIDSLEPWVTVQAMEEITVREGQTLTRIALRTRVENAAVKQFRVKLPGLGEDRARTVRATGPAVSDMVKLPDEPDLWEIRFQRGIAGDTDVQIEFQGLAAGAQSQEAIAPPEFVGARQAVLFVAVRGGGRLEVDAGALPRGWTRVDWSAVPPNLQDRNDRSVPALCFRVAEPEGPLALSVRRHEVAEALKLRVTHADLTTLFSPAGAFLTAAEFKVDVLETSTLRVRLPEGARLFNTFVNGESVTVVRENDAYLFHVATGANPDPAATVRLVYAVTGPAPSAIGLTGPRLSVPLEKVTWRVVLPPGYDLKSYRGGLELAEERSGGLFGLEQYQSLVASRRSAEAQQAAALLQEANTLLQRGDQQKAGEALSKVSNARALDEASNEDARVQLRNLKTQQTVLGLNTRRQRLYLDNRAEAARNEQLEQAANLNPFMQGQVNFDPGQVDQLLMGNTVEENAALRGIATRLVDQQLTAEPPPGAIDVTLAERGRVLTFTRSLQVDGSAPLELTVRVAPSARTGAVFSGLLLLAIAGIVAIQLPRRAES